MIISIDRKDTERRRHAILAKLAEIGVSAAQREDIEVQNLPDLFDNIQWQTARDIAAVQIDRQAKLARDLRDALDKIESGEYGICEDCENPISPRRLDVLPQARLCVRCQERAESHRAGDDVLFEEAA